MSCLDQTMTGQVQPPGGATGGQGLSANLSVRTDLAAGGYCVRAERIARIRAAIATGTYHISAEEIAHRLVLHRLRSESRI